MSLDEYIASLEQFSNDLEKIIQRFIDKNSLALLNAVKNRFWNKGIDGNLNLIGGGKYAESTIKRKKRKASARTSHITLRDTGDWWKSLFVLYENGELQLSSTDHDKTLKLINGEFNFRGYGQGIMEFTPDEKRVFLDNIKTDLYKYFRGKI